MLPPGGSAAIVPSIARSARAANVSAVVGPLAGLHRAHQTHRGQPVGQSLAGVPRGLWIQATNRSIAVPNASPHLESWSPAS